MTHRRPIVDDSDLMGAKRAVVNATASLAIAESRTGLVNELTSRLKIERSENHFIQRLNMHKNRNDQR